MVTQLSQEQAAILKNKYATAEEFKASQAYNNMKSDTAKQLALSAYSTPVTVAPVKTDTPVDNMVSIDTTSKTNKDGEIINPTPEDVQKYNEKYTTIPDTTKSNPNEPSKTDTSSDRLTQIQQNLTGYASTRPDLFTDKTKYDAFFGYKERAPEQQSVLDSFFQTQKLANDKLKKDTERYGVLNTMSTQDLQNITDVNDVAIINADPNLLAKYQKAQDQKQMLEFVYGKDYSKPVEPKIDGLDQLPGNLNTEISQASLDYKTKQDAMDKLNLEMSQTYDNLLKEHEGTGASDSFIRAKANKLNAEKKIEYNKLASEAKTALNKYSILATEAQNIKDELTAKRQEWAQNLNVFNSMYGDFSERNAAPKADPNIGKTVDLGTAKSPKIMMWNTKTQSYDIPLAGGDSTGTGGGLTLKYKGDGTIDYTDLIKTISASGKFTKQQKQDLIDGINSGGDVRTIALNQAKNIMGASNATDLVGLEKAIEQMKGVNSLLSEYYKAGGKTNIFKGTMENVISRLGEVNNEKLRGIAARIAIALQAYRKAITGTAYSVQEGQDIATIFPGINKSEALNRALIDGQIDYYQSAIDTTYSTVLGPAYDKIKSLGQKQEAQSAGPNKLQEREAKRGLISNKQPANNKPIDTSGIGLKSRGIGLSF